MLLPYSYLGAQLLPNGEFQDTRYTANDSKSPLCSSVKYLAGEIASVHKAWSAAAIYLVGHSYGGLVAETWWFDEHSSNGGHCVQPSGMRGVRHVFSLDSPINGVRGCQRAGLYVGAAGATWCTLWGGPLDIDHGVSNGKRIAALDDSEQSYTAVGTPNDPTYGTGPLEGGGGLESQLVYDCYGRADENDPGASCIDRNGTPPPVSYPSAAPECDGMSGDIYGTINHDIVKSCPAVIQLIVATLGSNSSTFPGSKAAGSTPSGSQLPSGSACGLLSTTDVATITGQEIASAKGGTVSNTGASSSGDEECLYTRVSYSEGQTPILVTLVINRSDPPSALQKWQTAINTIAGPGVTGYQDISALPGAYWYGPGSTLALERRGAFLEIVLNPAIANPEAVATALAKDAVANL